jgi:hypothetical protein
MHSRRCISTEGLKCNCGQVAAKAYRNPTSGCCVPFFTSRANATRGPLTVRNATRPAIVNALLWLVLGLFDYPGKLHVMAARRTNDNAHRLGSRDRWSFDEWLCVTGLKRTSPVSPRHIDLLVALPDEAQRFTVRSSERIFSRQDLLRLTKSVSDRLNYLHGPLHRLACEHSTPEQRFDL